LTIGPEMYEASSQDSEVTKSGENLVGSVSRKV
jgi:hypothetical protein